MANTSSTNIIADHSAPSADTTKSSLNGNQMDTKPKKRKLTPEQYDQLHEKFLEMEQIKYEEQLVHERIHSINLEKQHLQSLLNLLHTMDNPERIKTPRSRSSRLTKIDSSSRLH